ncbi:MAG: DUF4304 domain-containing protein [Acidobacteria bacterium]|nr:DUF4304 domain-containing protein [Acidobacteriota bacterium]
MKEKSKYVLILNEIQKIVFHDIKPFGFKMKGRTFNREVEKGIFHVINFQSGQFEIGQKYDNPLFKTDYYGEFTVNLGVCIEELNEIKFGKLKPFYQDYDCTIRTRLGQLLYDKDFWWKIEGNSLTTARTISDGILQNAMSWFQKFETRDDICKNHGTDRYSSSNRAKLDIALIVLRKDREKGVEMFLNYLNDLEENMTHHKNYILELATSLGISVET